MLFQLYNNEKINLSLQEKKDNVFSLVSKEGKEYLSLKKGELNRLDFNYDPFLFSESESSVAQKIDELYHQFMEDNFYGVESENEDNEDNEDEEKIRKEKDKLVEIHNDIKTKVGFSFCY